MTKCSFCDDNSYGFIQCHALFTLSNNDEYNYGEFYVGRQFKNDGDVSVIRMRCPKLNVGDLVIFRADKDGDNEHGKKIRGERVAVAVAVGLLQPGKDR